MRGKQRVLSMSRWLVVVVGLVLLTLLLTACGGGNSGPVTFSVFGDPEELAAYEALVAAFEAEFPDIDIELRHVPGQNDYRQRLATEFAAGAPPDVFLLNYRRLASFAADGGLEPLTDYLAGSEVFAETDFYATAINPFKWGGDLWCIPQNASSLVVYYNEDLFAAAGVPLPTRDWTRDDFIAAAVALTQDTDGDGVVDQYGVGIEASLYRLAPFVWQNGGDIVDDPANPTRLTLNSPEAREALQWFVDIQVVHHAAPDRAAESAEDSESRFLNGRLAMFFDSRRVAPTFRTITSFAWNVAPIPNGSVPAGILHSDGYCLAAAAENKDAAWTFIEYANSVPGQEAIAATGRTVPSLIAVAESSAFLDGQPPTNSQVYLDNIPTLRTVPTMDGWVGIEEAATQEIERAFYGEATVDEAVAAADELAQPFFEEAARQ